jgi:nucleoside-diphosphate-sugar epimerase
MILVAGGNGYLGRPFCEKLAQTGLAVLSLDLTRAETTQYQRLVGDIRDRETLDAVFDDYPITTVVNLASILVSASTADPLASFQVNVIGSFNLLSLCHKYTVPRFVFGSSYSALGNPSHDENPIDECIAPQPTDFYGQTKAFVEEMGTFFSQLGGFQFVSARMPMIVGPGKPTTTSAWRAEMFNLLSVGGSILIDYMPDEVIPLAHYEDAAYHLVSLTLSENLDHSTYHLPYETWRVKDLGRTLKEMNPRLEISYGERRLHGSPTSLAWSRIREELGLQQPSLLKRFQEEKKRSE